MGLEASHRYSEAGAWARHFSTVRATLTTFLITVAVGVVATRWDVAAPWPFWTLAIVAVAIWILALAMLVMFSKATYKFIERQNDIEKSEGVTQAHGSPRAEGWCDGPVKAFFILSLGFVVLLWSWHQHALTYETSSGVADADGGEDEGAEDE